MVMTGLCSKLTRNKNRIDKATKKEAVMTWALTALLFLIGWFTALPSVAVPASTPLFDKPQASPQLVGDKRLERKVTLDEVGVPLSDLLKKVSDTGLTLTCSRACEDQKLQVRLKDRSLRPLLDALAQMLPGTWKHTDTGYRLEMDDKATDYRERWWQVYQQERERVLANQRAAVLSAMQRKPYMPKPRDPNPENVSPETYDKMAAQQEFWNLLPPDLQERIANQMLDTAFYRSGSPFYGAHMEGGVVVPFSCLPLQAQTLALDSASHLLNGNPMGVPDAISFNNGGFNVRPRIATTDGKWWDMDAGLSVLLPRDAPTLGMNHAGLPPVVKRLGEKAPETWKRLADYQESRVWPNDPPANKPDLSNIPRRMEVLNRLSDKAGLEFVADYYSVAARPLTLTEKKQPLSRKLKDELDYRAAEQGMSWKKRDDGLYLFRNNRWYRDDALEVPDPVLKRLLPLLRACDSVGKGNIPGSDLPGSLMVKQLNLMQEAVSSLTLWQIANGLTYYVPEQGSRTFDPAHPVFTWRPFALTTENILSDYYTLRFYADLVPDQQSVLLAGRLSLATLSEEQRQEATFVVPDLQIASIDGPLQQNMLGLQIERSRNSVALSGYISFASPPPPPLELNLVVVPQAPAPGGQP